MEVSNTLVGLKSEPLLVGEFRWILKRFAVALATFVGVNEFGDEFN